MDAGSTLVLEGEPESLPSLNVSDSATVDGQLVFRISIPSKYSAFSDWQNFTVMKCRQCKGAFRSVHVETVGTCSPSIKEFQQYNQDNAYHISVLFNHLEACFATAFLPPLLCCIGAFMLSLQ